MNLEDKSDALDARILAVSARGYKQEKMRTVLLWVVLVFMITGFTSMSMLLRGIAQSTNDAVKQEIPGLQEQIRQRDQTIKEKDKIIADQQHVLVEQAVPAIQRLSLQVKQLGGDPGQVILKAPN